MSVRPPNGAAPSVPLKDARIVGVPPATGMLKITPSLFAPQLVVIP